MEVYQNELATPENTITYHNAFGLSSQNILHKHCLQFLLGVKMAPRETENNAYAKFWGDKQRTLWCVMVFLEWSIRDLIFFVGVCAKDRVFSDKLVSPDGSTILMEMLKVSLISIEFSRYM